MSLSIYEKIRPSRSDFLLIAPSIIELLTKSNFPLGRNSEGGSNPQPEFPSECCTTRSKAKGQSVLFAISLLIITLPQAVVMMMTSFWIFNQCCFGFSMLREAQALPSAPYPPRSRDHATASPHSSPVNRCHRQKKGCRLRTRRA